MPEGPAIPSEANWVARFGLALVVAQHTSTGVALKIGLKEYLRSSTVQPEHAASEYLAAHLDCPLDPKRTLLIVDDNDDVRGVTASLLKMEGFEVNEAGDGLQAIAAVAANMPDAILMDYTMPGMNGIEAARRIKEMQQAASTSIVLYTAISALDERCVACDSVLNKPADPHEIAAALRDSVPGPLGAR
jgi:CheY-like chemotaxis protein